MPDDENTENNENNENNENQEANDGKNVLGGDHQTTSPFDSFFGDEAKTFQDPVLQDWVTKQKDGPGMEKGIAGLRKVASQKSFERPAADASDEDQAAFSAHMRVLNGIPESVEDFKVEFGEESGLSEEETTALRDWAHKEGVPALTLEKFIPFNQEFAKGIAERHVEAELEKTEKLFGGKDEFGKVADELHRYIDLKGYDYNDSAFRNAQTWKMVQDMQAMDNKIRELTGEDKIVNDDKTVNVDSQKEAINKEINDILFGDSPIAKAFENAAMGQEHLDAKARYLTLTKQLKALSKK